MSSATVLAFVGLGSNLDRPQRQVLDAHLRGTILA